MSDRVISVLIVDDDVAVRESFCDYFEDHGWQVWAVGTAEEALVLLDRVMPDAAIVDIRLPGMDGNSFLRAVSEAHPELPCIICTGSPEYDPPADVLALRKLVRRVFAKPVPHLGELAEAVREQLGETINRGTERDSETGVSSSGEETPKGTRVLRGEASQDG